MARTAAACRKHGAKKVWLVATHGVFSSGAAAILRDAPIDRLLISDTVPLPPGVNHGNEGAARHCQRRRPSRGGGPPSAFWRLDRGAVGRRAIGRPSATEAIMSSNALFADLYQMTMLRAYFELGMAEEAAFSLFVRKLPPRRNFLIACGLADLLKEIKSLRFDDDQLRYLRSLGDFPDSFLEWLREFRFTGDIYALPEGTPFFANEPILEVVAPIAQAQLIETLVLNQIGLQTILASKAARIVTAARGRPVADFGARRAQGIDAATKGARAFYIGGVAATSNLAAGKAYGIPVSGTMAHSFVEACASEAEAFDAFARIFPETTLLVDTYDTLAGVAKVIALSRSLGPNFKVRAIRLDSGDLDQLARLSRRMLDDAGLTNVQIVASGGLDEDQIDRLTACNAPIDLFGVGTDLAVSSDAPALDIAYKLVDMLASGE